MHRSVTLARLLAERLLEPLPHRFVHVMAVGQRGVEMLGDDGKVGDLLVTAALLHDVGYSPEITEVEFHPLDGARFLQADGWDESIVNLVANHSCAEIEADLRGLGDELRAEFPRDPDLPHDELCFCDMTTGPAGQLMTVDERLADITNRYGPESIVAQFVEMAGGELRATVARVQARIDSA